MSLLDLQKEIELLSPEDRATLRERLLWLDVFGNSEVMEELTRNNRAAESGAVITRDELIERLRAAGKQVE